MFLTNYSRKDLLSVLPPGTSVGEVANGLVENHRVAIGDAKLEQFITQSDLVRVIHEKKLFGGLENKTVKELSLGTASVITIKNTERVVEAFKKIVIKKITGVGVVDENNKIVGQVSSSDIKCISTTGEMIQQLYLTYPEYRKNLEETYKVPLKTITVSESDTFQTVIATLVSNKLHRVFVAGEDNSLISVISLTDIIKKLVTK
uniref:CBS domain-containing protein n=1 Tax=Arcella intermedia TaxID=1963864 RepID=A0A6B2LBX7_9EUKA